MNECIPICELHVHSFGQAISIDFFLEAPTVIFALFRWYPEKGSPAFGG